MRPYEKKATVKPKPKPKDDDNSDDPLATDDGFTGWKEIDAALKENAVTDKLGKDESMVK